MAEGGTQELECDVLVDASGQASWGSRVGLVSERVIGQYDKQVAIFSQVAGAQRDGARVPGDTVILYKEFLHWAWFIPLDDEVVSVGVVAPATYFQAMRESKRDYLSRELRELNPMLKHLIPKVKLVEETRAIPNYSFRVFDYTGRNWLCVGDAHRFIDPIFSFGMYVSVKEAYWAARAIRGFLEGAYRDEPKPFLRHQHFVDKGMDKFEILIDAFWSNTLAFAWVVNSKYRSDLIDIFAGRVYDGKVSKGLQELQAVTDYERGIAKCPNCGRRLGRAETVCGCGGSYGRGRDDKGE
jgi:flavin-dependent dehydrogenase